MDIMKLRCLIGMNCDIEVESASDFMAMLVSVRLVGYEFIEDKNK